ncbi:MAG TPA: hypothetical protein VLA72_11545 [Anaerolineales bacterium]|nr:hypothetical protein [Anaerolineales bacterium]
MAEIKCSNCGKENPDFFDNCQFCQEPLKLESTLQPGENPAEMDTGDLEPILPDWLQDARQQSRDSGDAESFSPETRPRIQTNEPQDLLAGLAAQDDSDEDEVPDWLASISPVEENKTDAPSTSDDNDGESSDFFSQFSQAESQPVTSSTEEPEQSDAASLLPGGTESQSGTQEDELGGWFSQASAKPSEPATLEQGSVETEDSNWMNDLDSSESPALESPDEKEPEDLSWLHDLETEAKKTSGLSSEQTSEDSDIAPAQPESSREDLSWLNDLGGTPAPATEQPAPAHTESSDEDLDWLNDLGGTPVKSPVEKSPSQPESSQEDLSWMDNLGGDSTSSAEITPSQPEPAQKTPDWLSNLEGSDVSSTEEPVQAEAPKADLSWMDNLGGEQPSATDEPAAVQSETGQENLSWMANLGAEQESSIDEAVPSQSESPQEDLDWLKNLGEATQEAGEPSPSQTESPQEDLSWMANLGAEQLSSADEAAPSQIESSQDDLSWMDNLGTEQDEPAIQSTERTPPGTAPLDANAGRDSTPDWLKSAMEEPLMPAPGDLSMDWFADADKQDKVEEISDSQMDEKTIALPLDEPASVSPSLDLPLEDSSAASLEDVDAMFNIDIPDVASQEDGVQSETGDTTTSGDESLAPVELPSWVQAMRPVDSAIGETAQVGEEEQVVENEGPLAGFSGVIPAAPIGSSLRPKAFSMKLQVTDEQQAGASLIEQIITSETAAHPSKSSTVVASQQMLRQMLTVLFLTALTLAIGFGWRNFDVLPPKQEQVDELSQLVAAIPDGAPVLMIVDYEPAVAGEMTAAAGPILDQLAQSRHSAFTFISMSPNGSAMVEHLMLNAKVADLGYATNEQYFNMGFLPGGSAGILGFINNPVDVMPKLQSLENVSAFSSFEVVILMTDNAESGRVWIEQLDTVKQIQPEIASKPLVVVSSAQAGPMLEPYVSSGQVNVMINGLPDAAKYEFLNQSRPGIARTYWDAFGVGLMLAVLSIVLGSVWNLFTGIRERRAEAEQG